MRYVHLRTGRLCLDAVTRGDLEQLHEFSCLPGSRRGMLRVQIQLAR
jgi:hypothetical protein